MTLNEAVKSAAVLAFLAGALATVAVAYAAVFVPALWPLVAGAALATPAAALYAATWAVGLVPATDLD